MTDIDEVIKAWEEAVYWLKRFKENPEDPEADENCVIKSEKAIKKYIKWVYEDEYEYIAGILKKIFS